jgi:hypothetical protein
MLRTGTENSRSIQPAVVKPDVTVENRRIQRISLPLPVRVEIRVSRSYVWNEITRLSDVSAFGAGFNLKRPVKRGRVALLTVPMPRQLRSYDYSEPQYKIWGLVRRCISIGRSSDEPLYAIGVAFIGSKPPAGFLDNPSKLYDTKHRDGEGFWHITEAANLPDDSDLPNDIRRQTRFFIPEPLTLETFDDSGNILNSEATVTENLSLGGASVFTSFQIEPGTFLRVSSDRHNVKIIAVVRGKRVGADGITRLHLEFIDRHFPLDGIESDVAHVTF